MRSLPTPGALSVYLRIDALEVEQDQVAMLDQFFQVLAAAQAAGIQGGGDARLPATPSSARAKAGCRVGFSAGEGDPAAGFLEISPVFEQFGSSTQPH